MPSELYITGIGIVSPAGLDTETTWSSLVAGKKFARFLDDENQIAACVADFIPPVGLESSHRAAQLAAAAADQAIDSAQLQNLDDHREPSCKIGISFGFSKGHLGDNNKLRMSDGMDQSRDPIEYVTGIYNTILYNYIVTKLHNIILTPPLPGHPAGLLASRCATSGPVHATVCACSSGTHAIIRAAQMIHDGDADMVLGGFRGPAGRSIGPVTDSS